MITACEVVVTYDCTDENACTKTLTKFVPNGEGALIDIGPTLTAESEKPDICQAGIDNNDDQLKTQCDDPTSTQSDIQWDATNYVCYYEVTTEYYDG